MDTKEKTYVISGSVSAIELRETKVKGSPRPYAIAKLMMDAKDGKPSEKIPVLTFYTKGIDYLRRLKEGERIQAVGFFDEFKNKSGNRRRYFALMEKYKSPQLKIEDSELSKEKFESIESELEGADIRQIAEDYINARNMGMIPKREENLYGAALYLAASGLGRLAELPNELKSEEAVLKPLLNNSTAIHTAARLGRLNLIEKKYLTEKNLSLKDSSGINIYHLAAYHNCLSQIPKEEFKKEHLMQKINKGRTVFHIAALKKSLGDLPQNMIDAEALMTKDEDGNNFVDIAKKNINLGLTLQ